MKMKRNLKALFAMAMSGGFLAAYHVTGQQGWYYLFTALTILGCFVGVLSVLMIMVIDDNKASVDIVKIQDALPSRWVATISRTVGGAILCYLIFYAHFWVGALYAVSYTLSWLAYEYFQSKTVLDVLKEQ